MKEGNLVITPEGKISRIVNMDLGVWNPDADIMRNMPILPRDWVDLEDGSSYTTDEVKLALPLGLLNSPILTSDGEYKMELISAQTAAKLYRVYAEADNIDSAIGHESTAKVLSTLFDANVPANRQQFKQQVGQKALVCRLLSRIPEGKILSVEEIEDLGYEFKILTRIA